MWKPESTGGLISGGQKKTAAVAAEMMMAGATRLELATSGLTGRRSNQTELRPRQIISNEASNIATSEGGVKYLLLTNSMNFLTFHPVFARELPMGSTRLDIITTNVV